jgi:pimeloyl-ACP methyl ester carboxylesterase
VQGVGRVRLAYLDYGGTGPGVLLLHDLLARATTWDETARWLTPRFRAVALDSRGHGWSDAPQGPYDLPAHVGDATTTIERLGLGPALVIGHAMGALTALALAVARPDLVRALVLASMVPDGAPAVTQAADLETWLDTWPVPFTSLARARAFFGARHPSWADYYLEVLAESADGYRPMVDRQHIAQARAAARAWDHWNEAERVRCPALIVTGARAGDAGAESRGRARRLRHARYLEVPAAGHLVHYDQPRAWRAAVEPFLLQVIGERPDGPDTEGVRSALS